MLLTTSRRVIITKNKLWSCRWRVRQGLGPLAKRTTLSSTPCVPSRLASSTTITDTHHKAEFTGKSKQKSRGDPTGTDTTSSPAPLATTQSWSDEWKILGLGARLPPSKSSRITNLLFVQTGFGVDQHGHRDEEGATKAAMRAVRNAIEFNSIPGVIEAVPGGRKEMLIQVLLGVPPAKNKDGQTEGKSVLQPIGVDLESVAKVFPYGRLLPIQVEVGGLAFPTGRIVQELGDEDDMAICVAACVSIGYDSGERPNETMAHTTYSTQDGF